MPVPAIRLKRFSLRTSRHPGWLLGSASDVWASEDFQPATAPSTPTVDPWDPLASIQKTVPGTGELDPLIRNLWNSQIPGEPAVGTEDSPTINSNQDFWDPLFAYSADAIATGSDWSDDIALSEFASHARENPFELRLYVPTAEHHAQRRSRWLVGLLDIPTHQQRQHFLALFEELFETYPHSATFSRLADLALEETSANDLGLAYELKQFWNANPQWWCFRTARLTSPMPALDGQNLMSWSRALTFIDRRPGLPPEAIIEPDWLLDWYNLQYGDPLYWRFLDYAGARIDAYAAGNMDMSNARSQTRTNLQLSIDGLEIGTSSRTGILIRSLTDSLTFTHVEADALSAASVKA